MDFMVELGFFTFLKPDIYILFYKKFQKPKKCIDQTLYTNQCAMILFVGEYVGLSVEHMDRV